MLLRERFPEAVALAGTEFKCNKYSGMFEINFLRNGVFNSGVFNSDSDDFDDQHKQIEESRTHCGRHLDCVPAPLEILSVRTPAVEGNQNVRRYTRQSALND